MNRDKAPTAEVDPRFPSGSWTGFFLQEQMPGRQQMELQLRFCENLMRGEGRDRVGEFTLAGRYETEQGTCYWTKRYIGQHDVYYKGFNEGKGIWGTWEIALEGGLTFDVGGFHIWPEGMPDPTGSHLSETADLPVRVESEAGIHESVVGL